MAISVSQARQICTKAELDLVLQSTTRMIGDLDAKQLRAVIRRARTLRDKWRDLANSQTRDTKVEDPGDLDRANARSGEKAELFDEALTRFEKRLTRVEARSTAASGATKHPPKKDRGSEQRANGSGVRSTSNAKSDALNAPTRKTPAKASAQSSASADKPAAPSGRSIQKASGKKLASKQGGPKKPAPKRKSAPKVSSAKPAGPTTPPIHGLAAAAMAAGRDGAEIGDKPTGGEKKRNLKAKTAAKASAVNRSGAPRIQGHISSQGRRNQAKRSSR